MRAMRLLWEGRSVPHAVLDIVRGCNIACRSCYNRRADALRPLAEVRRDLEVLLRERDVRTITLSGGEPLLHPELDAIIASVRARGIEVMLLTNGLLLDARRAARLKAAGVGRTVLHIQADQRRPDLPEEPTPRDVAALRGRKLALLAEHGLASGVAYTVFPDGEAELETLVADFLASADWHFLLLTTYCDFAAFGAVTGDFERGFYCSSAAPAAPKGSPATRTAPAVALGALARAGLTPFAFLGSDSDPARPHCYAYFIGVAEAAGARVVRSLESSLLERGISRAVALARRRPVFMLQPGRRLFQLQLLLNALCGGRVRANLELLGRSLRAGAGLDDKHIILELTPEVEADGRLVICRDCPDATVRDGRLVPNCLADALSATGSGGAAAPRL